MKSIADLANLKGRVALITGGAGHIGRAMASALIELGCTVLLVDRDEPSLNTAFIELSKNGLASARIRTCDLADVESVKELRNYVEAEFGRLDILVNNAAFVGDSLLSGWCTDFEKQELETWKRALDLNLSVPFALVQAFSALLAENNNGTVINIGSIYGIVGPDMSLYEGTTMGNPAAYAASKGGLTQLTRWLATNLAPSVRVNTLSPGGVFRHQPKAFTDRFVKRTPMQRMATEEDFKGAVAYLASDLSRYVTGQNIVVDGGFSIW